MRNMTKWTCCARLIVWNLVHFVHCYLWGFCYTSNRLFNKQREASNG